jgi:hypothetical protein
VALVVLLALVTAGADDERAPGLREAKVGYFSAREENDLLGNGEDRHYTHGFTLGYVSEAGQFGWVRELAGLIGCERERARAGLFLAQEMFTPGNVRWSEPGPFDRPYAGWLYGTGALYAETTRDDPDSPPGEVRDRALSSFELSLGVVGPASGAAPLQRAVHDLIKAPHPNGWHDQLHDEPGALFHYTYQRRLGFRAGYLEVDVTPSAGFSLGNVLTEGELSFTVRLGHQMIRDWGTGHAFFALPASKFTWYVFAGAAGHAVAHDIFLDGNTFGDGPRVSKRPFVGELRAGVALTLMRVRVSYTNVLRSPQFRAQTVLDDYGVLELTFAW